MKIKEWEKPLTNQNIKPWINGYIIGMTIIIVIFSSIIIYNTFINPTNKQNNNIRLPNSPHPASSKYFNVTIDIGLPSGTFFYQ